jgi:branched-chain amino acid transport system permease protein
LPFGLALLVTLLAMILLGLLIEKFVLRPLVNQPQISLFMATIGLSFLIEGLAQLLWGANVRGLDIGIQDEPLAWIADPTGINVSKFDLAAAGIARSWSLCWRFSSAAPASAARCAQSPTITRRRWPWASRCSRSGRSSGRSPDS